MMSLKCKTLAILASLFFPILTYSSEYSVEVQENVDQLVKNNQCVNCNLVGVNLNRLDLAGADLSGADLSGATFFLTNLSGANLKNSILRGARFGGADLAEADLRGADIRGAEMKGAYLAGALIEGSFEKKAVSDDEDLSDIKEVVYIQDDSEPKEIVETQKVEIAKRRDFGPVPPTLDSSSVAKDQALQGPTSIQKTQPPPPLKKATLPGGITIEEKAGFTSNATSEQIGSETKNIEKLQSNSDVSGIEEKTILTGKDNSEQEDALNPLPPSEETSEDSEKDKLPEAKLKNDVKTIVSIQVKLLEDTNKCYKCDFSGISLVGKNLEEADLEGADFSNADLREVNFEDANLKGAVFSRTDLTDADFSGADLYKADFSEADLTGANFKDAKIDEAVFTGAKGYQINLVTE